MTKEEMLNLKLYECNRKQCSGFRSCDTGHCHLTTNADFAVNPEQVLGYEALIRDQLDDNWCKVRGLYLDAIVKADYYPEGAQTAAEIVYGMLCYDVHENLKKLRGSMEVWMKGEKST